MSGIGTDAEWKELDFTNDVRPTQVDKLDKSKDEVAAVGKKQQIQNQKSMQNIDQIYKEYNNVEKNMIVKKMENMNLISESELQGIKFIHEFAECSREQETLNTQVNQIQSIIALLQNELSKTTTEAENMDFVFESEKEMLQVRDKMTQENDTKVLSDLHQQNKGLEHELQYMDSLNQKQNYIFGGLNDKSQQVSDDLERQVKKLELENSQFEKEHDTLETEVNRMKIENANRKTKSRKLKGQISTFTSQIEVMEYTIEKIVFENVDQFDQYQEVIHENNVNIHKIREDLGNVQKQHFEMGNINESLEQRIDQLKGQRYLSIFMAKAGQAQEIKAQKDEAICTQQKLIDLQNDNELTWEDKLVLKMRELDEAMKQSSDESINSQVQTYLQQVRDKNEQIVELTKAKEDIESKMLQEVPEAELAELTAEHQQLVREYEQVIKEKIDIFTLMIKNLNDLSQGNTTSVENEERIAQAKLSIEVWDRDIYQKKRVSIDIQVEIQNMLLEIENDEKKLAERIARIAALERELEETEQEYKDFNADTAQQDDLIIELKHKLENSEEERARLEAEEAERRRLEELERASRPKPAKVVRQYTAAKGCAVDEKMAFYINDFDLDIPIQRVGDGQYMFGSRKIFAKIMNDKLVIRVGGGYMLIDEFLATYGQAELDKINAAAKRGMPVHTLSSPSRKGSPSAGTMFKGGRASPTANRASPTANRASPTANRGFK